jgi:hypothetical protein
MKSYSVTLSCGRVESCYLAKANGNECLAPDSAAAPFFALGTSSVIGADGWVQCLPACRATLAELHSHKTSSGLCSLPQRRLHSSLSEPQAEGAIVIQPLTAQSSRFRGERLHV